MRCADVRENLVAWLDGELAPETREQIDSHLASCSDCLSERAALASTGDLLRHLAEPITPADDLAARVLRAAHQDIDPWCRHIRRELVAFMDGELDGVESRPVVEHLSECESCERERRDLERTGAALALWRVPSSETDLLERLPVRTSPAPSRILRLVPALAAACTLVLAGLAWHVLTPADPDIGEPPRIVLQNLDLFQAESMNLLDENATYLEMLDNLEWLESVSADELALLSDRGG